MATYQKRGGKPKTKKEKVDKIEEESTTAEVFNTLDEGASKTEKFFSKYQSIIIGLIVTVIVCILGYLAYDRFIVQPKQLEASEVLSSSQTYFDLALSSTQQQERDSLFTLAIEGANNKFGFVDIANEYSSTKAGDLANYYAGVSYLNIGEYQKAIQHLEKFSANDQFLSALALGAIGDSFLQLEQKEEALSYYEKASKKNINTFTTPKFLFKAAITALNINKIDKALQFLESIKKDYPESDEAKKLDPYLGKAKAMKN